MTQRDWPNLPPPLLCSLAERLVPVAYARLRAVCTAWASAVSHEKGEEGQCQPYYLPRSSRCPWLMVPTDQDESTVSRTFLSLPESLSPYRIAVPELNGMYIFGSHASWLAAVDADCNAYLINPLTRSQIALPSVTTIKIPGTHHVEVVLDLWSGSPVEFLCHGNEDVVEHYTPKEFRDMYFRKIILSSSPGDFIIVFMFHYSQWLAYARAGDTAWSVLNDGPDYMDAVFLDWKLYAVAGNGQIDAFDFTQTEPQPTVVAENTSQHYTSEPRYLVFSSGDLLRVERKLEPDDIVEFRTSGFTIEKIDLAERGEKHCIRVPVHDLGCRSLFLGLNQSLSISTQEISGVRQNCIYFTDNYWDWFFDGGKQCTRDMGIYDLNERSCEPLYPPDAWLTWPPPIWFAPVLN